MANFTTVDDLLLDALWLAGEPAASTSAFYTRSLAYLNAVLLALVSGGRLGTVTVPKVDWPWANQTKRGQATILEAFNDDSAITVTATLASTTVTFSAMTSGLSLLGYRGRFGTSTDQLLYFSAHTASATTSTIDLAWKPATVASSSFVAWKDQIALPSDFVRLATIPRVSRAPYEIEVVDMNVLEEKYPRHQVWFGTPVCCAIVNAGAGLYALHFSHTPTDPLVAEFEYVFAQAALVNTIGTEEPTLPKQHRRVLSLGAAYLILLDKVDRRADQVGAQFRDAWEAMADEYDHAGINNPSYGRIMAFPNNGTAVGPLRTSSGLIIG